MKFALHTQLLWGSSRGKWRTLFLALDLGGKSNIYILLEKERSNCVSLKESGYTYGRLERIKEWINCVYQVLFTTAWCSTTWRNIGDQGAEKGKIE